MLVVFVLVAALGMYAVLSRDDVDRVSRSRSSQQERDTSTEDDVQREAARQWQQRREQALRRAQQRGT